MEKPQNLWVLRDIGPEWEIDHPASSSEIIEAARHLPGARVVDQPYETWGFGKLLVIPIDPPTEEDRDDPDDSKSPPLVVRQNHAVR